MEQLYQNMTGEKLLRKISRKAVRRIVTDILILAAVGLFAVGMTVPLFQDFKQNFWAMFLLPFWFLCVYYPVRDIAKQIGIIRSREQGEPFSRYGAPDEIAAVLADPENEQLLPCKRIILTRSYLMRRDDFITYIPLADLAAILGHVRHGKHPCVILNIWTRDGLQKEYRTEEIPLFRSNDKFYREIADALSEVLPLYAPDCRLSL